MNERTPETNGAPTHEQISAKAYEIFLARGGDGHGYDIQDWLTAEQQLREQPISTAGQEADVRGAEAEAAEEKRRAEIGADLPEPAKSLMTDVGESIPAESRKLARRPRAPRAPKNATPPPAVNG